jgi:hypothetical protein
MSEIITFVTSNPFIAGPSCLLIIVLFVFGLAKVIALIKERANNSDTESKDQTVSYQVFPIPTRKKEWFIPKEHEAECWRLYCEWMNKEGTDCYERYLFWSKVFSIFPEIENYNDVTIDEDYDNIKMRIVED